MPLLFNRARVATATTGTGTVTLGAAVAGYATLAEAGVSNGNEVSYVIEDGNDFEIGTGTYTASGTTLSRDTVTLSKISGTAGTAKINLSGNATVFLTARAEDFAGRPTFGIGGATADATNRLSANTPAVLFNRETDDIQVKLNKEATADTASFLFQTGFSGRAEIGLTGDDDFHFKVSPDNFATTFEGITIDKDDGTVSVPNDLNLQGSRLIVDVDLDTYIEAPSDDELVFTVGGVESEKFNGTEAVFNESGVDRDFRVEATGEANAFFVQGSNGAVGLGTNNPQARIEALGAAASSPTSAWFTAATFGFSFLDDQTQTAQLTAFAGATAHHRPMTFGRRSRGTLASPSTVVDGDWLFSAIASGFDGTDFQAGASINFVVDGTVSAGVVPTGIFFETGDNFADRLERLSLDSNGVLAHDNGGYWSSVEIGHATDTTLTRVSAGVAAIEGSNILLADVPDTLTAGFAHTPDNDGTQSSGTYTPDEAGGNMKRIVNGGAFTLAPPTNDCCIIVQITNNASAGAITTSGFSGVFGDAFTTTNGDDFICTIIKINGFSTLTVQDVS